MKQDILETIIRHKQEELKTEKTVFPMSYLYSRLEDLSPCISMKQHLAASPHGIIAEFKRHSPSKGWINKDANASVIPAAYQQAGASAVSVLTDEQFFRGSLKDIRDARPALQLPILRKDFIIDPYQLYQAKLIGADAVLLIAAALTPQQCRELAREARQLQLEVLLELHGEAELEYINEYTDMVGINNRNLGTFHTDVENSFRLAEKLPEGVLPVSESGISSPETVCRLRRAGFKGFLIGECFMKTDNPGEALAGFIRKLDTL